MSTANWEKFGEEIRKTVQDAVETQDFKKLNQTISNTVGQAADAVAQGMKNAADSAQQKYHGYKTYTTAPEGRMPRQENAGAGIRYTNASERRETRPFPIKAPAMAGPIAAIVFGYTLGALELLWLVLMLSITFLPDGVFGIGPRLLTGTFGVLAVPLMVLGFWLGIGGTRKLVRIRRFREYIGILGKREYCNVSEMAERSGRTAGTVVKDLEYMFRKRWFVQGRLDRQKQCLITTDAMYEQYCILEEQKKQQEEKEREQQQKNAGKTGDLPSELQNVIRCGEDYIRKLRDCNDAIPGEEISEKISRIELLTARIFERVRKNPEFVDDIYKMMEYYLPTTVKLLEAYAQMDAQPVGGANIVTAKKEIEDTLDTLNTAFEKLLDSLFQETAWDVSTDISVLNTMLAQEGLKEDGM